MNGFQIDAVERERNKMTARIAELEELVYVPGLWKCAKCDFSLVQANLNASDGSVTARNEPGDRCPNCDSPLWRVTEREAGNDMARHAEETQAEILRLHKEKCDHLDARLVAEAAQARMTSAVLPFFTFAKATERMLAMDPDHKITAGSPMAAPQLYARDFLALLAALNPETTP